MANLEGVQPRVRELIGHLDTPQAAPAKPAGGTTVDTEARAALGLVIDALVAAGVFE